MNAHVSDEVMRTLTQQGAARESEVIWSSSEGQVSNAGVYCLCLLFFWLVLPIGYALYRAVKSKCHTYHLTDQRLRESKGVFLREIEELELYRVKDISVHQSALQRVLNCGSVSLICSDRSTPHVVLIAVRNPVAVADTIRFHVENCRVSKGVREID